LLSCVLAAAPGAARAQSTPDAALLNELRERLTEAPPCAPTCAEIMRAQVHLAGDAIRVELEASALAPLALPVPSAGDHWRIETLAVDGASALAVAREPDDALWVPLRSGAHTIRIAPACSVPTTVERVAPQSAAFTVAVPLMPGESVLSEGLEVRGEGVALVGLAAGQRQREWTSSLAHRDALSLRFDAAPARAEIWRFRVNPQWRGAVKCGTEAL